MSKPFAVLLLATPLMLGACADAPVDQPAAATEAPGGPPPWTDATAADDEEEDLSGVHLTERNVRLAYEAYFSMLEAIRANPERYSSMLDGDEEDGESMGEDLSRYPELERIVEAEGMKIDEMARVMAAVSTAWFARSAPPEAQPYFENVPQHREFVAGHEDLVRTLLDRMNALDEELSFGR